MKFLVVSKPRGIPIPDNYADLLKAAKTYLTAKIDSGEIEALYSILPSKSIAIVNSDSHEKLWDDLVSYPLYPFLKLKIEVIVDWKYTFDKSLEMLSK